MNGLPLITVPMIQYAGYFLFTSLMNKSSGVYGKPIPSSEQGSPYFHLTRPAELAPLVRPPRT